EIKKFNSFQQRFFWMENHFPYSFVGQIFGNDHRNVARDSRKFPKFAESCARTQTANREIKRYFGNKDAARRIECGRERICQLPGEANQLIIRCDFYSERKVGMVTATKRQTGSRQFNRAFEIEEINAAFFVPPMNFTANVTPKENSYSFLFCAARWFENPSCFKDRDAFRSRTNVVVKYP